MLAMSAPHVILLLNVASTWFMVGLIWFVQVVHYPLFSGIPPEPFAAYHRRHVRRTTWVVAPVMLVELSAALALLWLRPITVPAWVAWAGLALLGIAWGSTWLLQIPRHNELAACYADGSHAALCYSNWLRTAAWTARGVLFVVAFIFDAR